ncbi:MAG: phenylalanine--tRNA ligase subunit beta [Candidatus Paceibacterota bacterium]|jgi:phenylalanyl-tRNA synthetase beta chain
MLISYKWLKSYVPDLPSPEKLADIFNFHICEVEEVKNVGEDTIFDIKILPDRAHDLLSHRGVARDLAGILGLKYNDINYPKIEGEKTNLEIKIETENCRRYIGRIVQNVKVEQSPNWVKEHLASVGQRSINNLVDATNIVMFDRGNPTHIFDLEKVHGKIIIRQAHKGEKMMTLDNKEVELRDSDMVIADEKNILALAGIKGGKIAEVDENTKNIIIEVANFNPTSVRRTARAINIYTDAVKRFENDLSPLMADSSMNDMSALIKEMCPEAIFEEMIDQYREKQEQKKLSFSIEKISKILGMNLSISEVKKVLDNFDFEYKNNENNFEVVIPFARLDLNIEEDMAEEIGRAIGYDKINAELPKIKKVVRVDETFYKILWTRNKLLEDGYSEVMNYAFCDKGEVEVLASASDKKFLRTNLKNGIEESIKLNQLNLPLLGADEVKIFEVGTVFHKHGEVIHVCYGDKKNITEVTLDEFCRDIPMTELDALLEKLNSKDQELKIFESWSVYPFITRDIAVWVPEGTKPEKLVQVYKDFGTELLIKEPRLFDSFTKDKKTSFAYRLVFQAIDRTLTDDEINQIMSKITQKIVSLGWQVR